jgi:POT family proton-dependent oligopeptide transporter
MDNDLESKEGITPTAPDAPGPVTDVKSETIPGLPGFDLGGTDVVQQKNAMVGFFGAHPTGFWFFFWGEFAERCSFYGMKAILAKYMVDKLGLGEANAGTYVSLFIAACYFLPLLGGWVADNFFGKYWTIVGFSLPYILGHFILGYESFTFMVIALSLLAMGSGVIKPNISTLMGLTYDQQRPGQTKLRSDAFAIFYFSINVGAALSMFAVPIIRSRFDYWVAFLFPAGLMVIAFAIFAAGKPYYAKEVIKRTPPTPEERRMRWVVLRRIMGLFALIMFFWAIFDQSGSTWIFFADTCMNTTMFGISVDADQIQAFNPVFILILLPLVTLLLKYLEARGWKIRPTDKMVLGFVLTAACMGIMAIAAALTGTPELRPTVARGELTVKVPGTDNITLKGEMVLTAADDVIVVTGKRKVLIKDGKEMVVGKDGKLQPAKEGDFLPQTVKISGEGIRLTEPKTEGGALQIATTGASNVKVVVQVKEDKLLLAEGPLTVGVEAEKDKGAVEKRWFVEPDKRVTVWWQIFAYLIITVAEVLISVTGLELAYTAAPKSMSGFVTGCWLVCVGMGNLVINAPITRLYPAIQPVSYFGMLTLTLVLVTIAFVPVARRFNASASEAPTDGAARGGH